MREEWKKWPEEKPKESGLYFVTDDERFIIAEDITIARYNAVTETWYYNWLDCDEILEKVKRWTDYKEYEPTDEEIEEYLEEYNKFDVDPELLDEFYNNFYRELDNQNKI